MTQCFNSLKFLRKKSSGGVVRRANKSAIIIEIMPNQQVAEELLKTIIRKFENRKVYPSFKDNIWIVYLANMDLITKFNEGSCFSLCFIDIFSKIYGLFL